MADENVRKYRFEGLITRCYHALASRGSRVKTCLTLALPVVVVFGVRLVRAQSPPAKSTPIATPSRSRWVGFFDSNNNKLSTMRFGDLVFTEKFSLDTDPGDFVGGDYGGGYQYYVQREGQRRRPLFTSMRGASIEVGHRDRLVLIDSSCATQCEEVYVADVETGKSWRVDEQAMQAYYRKLKPDLRLTISLHPIDFSPDDTSVLLSVYVVYVGYGTAEQIKQYPSAREEASAVAKKFVKAWYAVDSACGRVMHQYMSDPSGRDWWVR